MKVSEMKLTKSGNDQLYIPLSKKLEHPFKAGDILEIIVDGDRLIVTRK